jgi:outer membrane autotransporter protein
LSLEYGFTSLGNLRARVGDQGRVLDTESAEASDAWMHVYTHELDAAGGRFAARDVRMNMLQFGTDLYRRDMGEAGAHFGVRVSLGESSATFLDPERAASGLETLAGKVDTDVKGAGVYWTRYGEHGGYLDVSGQLLRYRNRYQDQFLAGGDQRGWGGTVSAEVGAAYALGATAWKIEPQIQLGYQRLELDDFTDNVSAVAAVEEDGLRARAGVQFFRAAGEWLGMSEVSPYVGLGVQRDFRDAESIGIGGTAVREEIPDTTAEVSIGVTGRVRDRLELHLDLRYQDATDGEKDGMRANFGFRERF